jgi:hypothetical protein
MSTSQQLEFAIPAELTVPNTILVVDGTRCPEVVVVIECNKASGWASRTEGTPAANQ